MDFKHDCLDKMRSKQVCRGSDKGNEVSADVVTMQIDLLLSCFSLPPAYNGYIINAENYTI